MYNIPENYRRLEVGEKIQKGDKIYHIRSYCLVDNPLFGMQVYKHLLVIRKKLSQTEMEFSFDSSN